MQNFLLPLLVFNALILLINAQGPYPPRLSIPGAIAVSGPAPRAQFRNNVRVRRPISQRAQNVILPTLPPRVIEETKPVTEAPEDEDDVPDAFLPTLLREQQLAQAQQARFQQQAAAFLQNEPNTIIDSPPSLQLLHHDEPVLLPTLPRFQERPQPAAQSANTRPVFNDYGIGSGISSSVQRFERPQSHYAPATTTTLPPPPPPPPSQQTPQRYNVVRTRRPQFEPQIAPAPAPAPPAPAPRPRPKPIQPRPAIEQNQVHEQSSYDRRQKPVAQTIRKWREENEDGSITWGYENDDGSFKEEIIGTDCVTKGTYGYVDPDGNKREYRYETGIKCDPNARDNEDEELQENGFVNYEENKAILPNGIEIDMSQLGKRKSKRPGAQLRN